MKVRVRRKYRSIKFFRNVIISLLCLSSILIGAAGVYVWYIGKYGPKDAASVAEPVETKADSTIKINKPDPNIVVGVSVQMLTSPVTIGSTASISVRTNAGAKCTISVVYNQIASKDPGLTSVIADDYGLASWTWTVGDSTPVGKWPVNVKCSNDSKSGVVSPEIEIVK